MMRQLRDQQPRIIQGIYGDTRSIRLLFRYLAWCAAQSRALPDFIDLQETSLDGRVSEAAFEIISHRIETIVSAYDLTDLSLRPIKSVKFKNNSDAERARRVRIYERQWQRRLTRSGRAGEGVGDMVDGEE